MPEARHRDYFENLDQIQEAVEEMGKRDLLLKWAHTMDPKRAGQVVTPATVSHSETNFAESLARIQSMIQEMAEAAGFQTAAA